MSTTVPHLVRTGEKLLRPGEVAELLGIAPQQVWEMTELGSLPVAVTTPGGHARFRWPDVEFALTAPPSS